MDEAKAHPLRDQARLALCDGVKQLQRAGGLRVVAGDGIAGQCLQFVHLAARGKELKAADADVAGGNAGQDSAMGAAVVAVDVFAGQGDGQCAGGGDATGRASPLISGIHAASGPSLPCHRRPAKRACGQSL